jgi:hypothetical protein
MTKNLELVTRSNVVEVSVPLHIMLQVFEYTAIYIVIGFLIIRGWQRLRIYRKRDTHILDTFIFPIVLFWPITVSAGMINAINRKYPIQILITKLDNGLNSMYDSVIHFVLGRNNGNPK